MLFGLAVLVVGAKVGGLVVERFGQSVLDELAFPMPLTFIGRFDTENQGYPDTISILSLVRLRGVFRCPRRADCPGRI